MNLVHLRSEVQELLVHVKSESFLHLLKTLLSEQLRHSEGGVWDRLSEEQKKTIYAALEESLEDANLTDWEVVKQRLQ